MGDIRPLETLAQNADVTGLLEEIAARLALIEDSTSLLSPDAAGRIRINAEVLANIATISTVTNVTTIATLTTLTTLLNQANIGGYAANQQMLALTQMAERGLRDNIVIS